MPINLNELQSDKSVNNYIEKCNELLELKDYITAIKVLEDAVEHNPKKIELYLLIGNLYDQRLKDYPNAINYLKKYLNGAPKDALIYNRIGYLYEKIDRYENLDIQIYYFEKAIELVPNYIVAIRNLALAYIKVERYEDAIKYFHKLFELGAFYEDYFAYACLKIQLRDFEEGWEYYESRFLKRFLPIMWHRQDVPIWKGEKTDKNLLVQFEQGYGDSIQFFRYIKTAKPLVGKIIFNVQEGMTDLFKSSVEDDDIEITDRHTLKYASPFHYQIPLMSLPYVLKSQFEDIPFAEGYLKADENKVKAYKEKYFNNDALKIGICWNGAKNGNKLRDIPLETFYPLTKLENVAVYSFQKKFGSEQLENIPEDVKIVNLGETFENFSDTAAAMANVDLFITSDNSVFNLAASMGIKTFVLLNKFCEWRWFDDDETTPWYKSVRIFKKKNEKDSWNSLIQKVLKFI